MLVSASIDVDGQVARATTEINETRPHAVVIAGAHAVVTSRRLQVEELGARSCGKINLHPLSLVLPGTHLGQSGSVEDATVDVEQAVTVARTNRRVADNLNACVRGGSTDAVDDGRVVGHPAVTNILHAQRAIVVRVVEAGRVDHARGGASEGTGADGFVDLRGHLRARGHRHSARAGEVTDGEAKLRARALGKVKGLRAIRAQGASGAHLGAQVDIGARIRKDGVTERNEVALLGDGLRGSNTE